jgi:diaminopimelate decarboxylase
VSRLIALGTGADCASREEIDLALRAGLDPSRIIFANPCKLPAHLRHARDVGVLKLTADNEEELYKVRKIHPNAEVIIRIQVQQHIMTDIHYLLLRLYLNCTQALHIALLELHLQQCACKAPQQQWQCTP